MDLEVIPDLEFEWHQIPRHVKPDFLEPTLGDVMWGLTAAREECRWMMTSLFIVMRHLGMDHPPFPSADPVVPHPSQPHIIGYKGTGPSGTHPGDTDDDNDDNDGDDDDDEETDTKSEGGDEYICEFYFVF